MLARRYLEFASPFLNDIVRETRDKHTPGDTYCVVEVSSPKSTTEEVHVIDVSQTAYLAVFATPV